MAKPVKRAAAKPRAVRFEARLEPIPSGGVYVLVPDPIAAKAGVKLRDRVRGTMTGQPWRASLARYRDGFHVGIAMTAVRAAGKRAGDLVAVTLEPDPDPLPGDELPDELAAALDEHDLRAGWERFAPSHRREWVKAYAEAKRPETRDKRLAEILDAIRKRPGR